MTVRLGPASGPKSGPGQGQYQDLRQDPGPKTQKKRTPHRVPGPKTRGKSKRITTRQKQKIQREIVLIVHMHRLVKYTCSY